MFSVAESTGHSSKHPLTGPRGPKMLLPYTVLVEFYLFLPPGKF